MFLQMSPILIYLSQVLYSSPLGIQFIYLVNAYINCLNCFKLVRLRFKKSWLFLGIEMKERQEHLPRTRAYMITNLVMFFAISVKSLLTEDGSDDSVQRSFCGVCVVEQHPSFDTSRCSLYSTIHEYVSFTKIRLILLV